MANRTLSRLVALMAVLALVLAACGGGDDGGGDTGDTGTDDAGGEETTEGGDEEAAGGGGGDLIVGTTDTVPTLDPAKCYSYYCSNILQNVGNTLVSFDPGGAEPAPQIAAELPEISEDGLTYTFTIKEGLTFHDGSDLTSEDVAFSINRARWMNHPEGAGFLYAGVDSIETPDDLTVEITLSEPDITFVSKLAYATGTVVPSDGDYTSPEAMLEEGEDPEEFVNEDFVGSGAYQLGEFRENQSITLEAFPDYQGGEQANDRVLVSFYQQGAQLKAALEAGEIDVAFRSLAPQERADLEGNEAIQVIEGEGASIRYIVINTLMPPFDDVGARQALAAAVDRDRINEDVFNGTVEPLFSMVPPGFGEAHVPSFEEQYADADPSEFAEGPIEMDLWYSTDHYGDTEPSIAQTLERTLEETGVFDVTLQSTEWAQFVEQAWPGENGQYQSFLLGWYPDYLDPDDYVYPFFHSETSFLQLYGNPQMDELIAAQQTASDPTGADRMETFAQIQQLAAEEVPTVPLFVETPVAFAQEGVTGVQDTMDQAQIFRYWLISPGE